MAVERDDGSAAGILGPGAASSTHRAANFTSFQGGRRSFPALHWSARIHLCECSVLRGLMQLPGHGFGNLRILVSHVMHVPDVDWLAVQGCLVFISA